MEAGRSQALSGDVAAVHLAGHLGGHRLKRQPAALCLAGADRAEHVVDRTADVLVLPMGLEGVEDRLSFGNRGVVDGAFLAGHGPVLGDGLLRDHAGLRQVALNVAGLRPQHLDT